jgi:hypothetical protein
MPIESISQLDWLTGTWEGDGLGGTCEEIWSRPQAGVMMGMFRLIKGGALAFYEFMTIEQEVDHLVLRIKHFDRGLIGWEKQDEVHESRSLTQGEMSVVFDGISYSSDPDGALRVEMQTRDNGHGQTQTIIFQRR